EVKDSTSRSLQVRLFVDGRYSAHSTTDVRPAEIERFVSEAVAMTRALQPDQHRRLPAPALYDGRPASLELVDPAVLRLDRERRVAWCQAMNARCAGKPSVISAESQVGDNHGIAVAVGTNGFSGAYEA